jgi:hypothetical protein
MGARDVATLLRRVILIGEAALCLRFDLERV